MRIATTSNEASLPPADLLLGVAITTIWGTNFVVIRFGLQSFPPLAFACLRFALVFVPAMLFVPRPKVGFGRLALYGAITGGGQFGLLFIALRGFISPGLGSLVIQCQVFFTVAIAAIKGGESLGIRQVIAAAFAVAGLSLIAFEGGGDASLEGLVLVLLAGLAWAVANILMRAGTPGGMLAFVIWSSPFAVLPLLILSLVFEGPEKILVASTSASALAWLSVVWQATGNTLFGFAAWGRLLQRHPAFLVAPLALLVPVFGIGSSVLLVGEGLQVWKIAATLLVIAGLGINLFGTTSSAREASYGPE
ncbi:MAG TPA: EamA family transporter [Sphingomicrobium sp.]|nr:EamA family transporter [Sphingomicrobium sp.]